MEIKFNVIKGERKVLVEAIGEITGWAPVYKGAPGFAFVVNNYTIDRYGTLIYDERTDTEDVRRLFTELSARGFEYEGDIDEIAPVSVIQPETATGDSVVHAHSSDIADAGETCGTDFTPATNLDADVTGEGGSAKKTIIVDMPFFGDTALDNLRKLINGKATLIKKSIGADDLTVAVINGALHFHWFSPDSTDSELDAYKQFVSALCLFAKNQKRVTMKESEVESEKFAFRCFLLRLGFIGGEYASARKVLLSKLSGCGSFKSGGGKKAAPVDSGNDSAQIAGSAPVPIRCGECRHHCYYTEGPLRTNTGDIVDTSSRAPDKYTHYCLNAPSGYRKIKHATDWSGCEPAPKWCPLCRAE